MDICSPYPDTLSAYGVRTYPEIAEGISILKALFPFALTCDCCGRDIRGERNGKKQCICTTWRPPFCLPEARVAGQARNGRISMTAVFYSLSAGERSARWSSRRNGLRGERARELSEVAFRAQKGFILFPNVFFQSRAPCADGSIALYCHLTPLAMDEFNRPRGAFYKSILPNVLPEDPERRMRRRTACSF